MKLSKWAKEQGISYITAFRWFHAGKLPVESYRTPSGGIFVKLPKSNDNKSSLKTYSYSRVSTYQKKDDLKRQSKRIEDFCVANGWNIEKSIEEIASGMNDKRQKLLKLLELPPGRLIIENKDRLTRFGFNYFDTLLPKLGWELVVINKDKIDENDLMKDLGAIITSFCCRLYGLRRGQNKAKELKEILK